MSADALDNLYLDHLRTVMARTDRSLAALGFEALVIQAGAPPRQFLDDQDYPYKVNPHFKAWVPIIDNPHCLLVYRPQAKPQVLFYQPDDYWHKPARLPTDQWTDAVDLIAIPDPTQALSQLTNLGRAAYIGPDATFPNVDTASLNNAELLTQLHYDRAVKTPYELECLRRANRMGAVGHRAALAAFHAGESEYHAHFRYLSACVQREEEMPYNNIVAYNEHAAVLHYQHLERRPPQPLRSFLIDAGAQYRGYAADITRSYAAASGRYADLVNAMDRAQLRLCAEVVAGKDYRDVHLSAHHILGDVMHETGITTIPGSEALDHGVTKVFFPHGIGHLLGLQVHDVGGIMGDLKGGERQRPEGHPYLRLTRMLEPGVVVTVEPGIYFIDSLLAAAYGDARRALINWNVVDELRPFGGVRIEDNVVATTSVPENMTRDAFAGLAA